MSAQKELVSKSVKEVEEVVELFYQQKLQEALAKFEPVLGEMMTAIDTIFTYRAEPSSNTNSTIICGIANNSKFGNTASWKCA